MRRFIWSLIVGIIVVLIGLHFEYNYFNKGGESIEAATEVGEGDHNDGSAPDKDSMSPEEIEFRERLALIEKINSDYSRDLELASLYGEATANNQLAVALDIVAKIDSKYTRTNLYAELAMIAIESGERKISFEAADRIPSKYTKDVTIGKILDFEEKN